MKACIGIALAVMALLFGGCATAPQQPVPLLAGSLSDKATQVGVVMTELPKVDTYFPGASCLLCYAAAAAFNSTLTTHTQTLPYEDLPQLKDRVAEVLRNRGMTVNVITESVDVKALPDYPGSGPNVARKDFISLRQKYKVEKLLVIDITALGIVRNYSSYVPTSDPKAVFEGRGYMVNLHTNAYEWYQPVSLTKGADMNWDEPPKFPGLTNAYFQVLELAKDNFIKPFEL